MNPTIDIGTDYIFHGGHIVKYPGGSDLPTHVFLDDLAEALRQRDALNKAIQNMEKILAVEVK